MNYLYQLDLSFNELESIPSSIGTLINLSSLFISNNKLKIIPNEICNLKLLKNLDLSFNSISSLPQSYPSLYSLTVCNLRRNKIKYLPNDIYNLTSLQILDLSANYLEYLPKEIGYLTNLKVLDVYHNKLQSLPIEINNLLNTLSTLYIGYNPLKIFPNEWLKQWNLKNQSNIISNNEYIFNLKQQLQDISHIYNLCLEVWKCDEEDYFNGKLSLQYFLNNMKLKEIDVDIKYRNIIELFYTISKRKGIIVNYEELCKEEKKEISLIEMNNIEKLFKG